MNDREEELLQSIQDRYESETGDLTEMVLTTWRGSASPDLVAYLRVFEVEQENEEERSELSLDCVRYVLSSSFNRICFNTLSHALTQPTIVVGNIVLVAEPTYKCDKAIVVS